MQSELTLNYSLAYTVTYDVELAKQYLPELWSEADDDDEFVEFVEDHILSRMEVFERCKARGNGLPGYITHFSVSESIG